MYKKNNVVTIIQARMGSTRLPGKVLRNIAERPMLWHIANRIKYSRFASRIVVATSVEKKDDAIKEFCEKYAIDFYRGSERDVLDRYYQTAKFYGAKCIVRITADCPLIDPVVVDRVVESYIKNIDTFDGSSNVLKRTYPRGLDTEVISFSSLKKLQKIAKREYQREHVTIFIHEHPELFKLYSVENKEDLAHLRWTIDEEADFIFVNEIYKRLYQDSKIFLMKDILEILKKKPYLNEINKGIKQEEISLKNTFSS